jgi:hypothetical protein
MRSEDVRVDEARGVENRAIDMRLRGEVDDCVAAFDGAPDHGRIADVAVKEAVLDPLEPSTTAGVRELVEDDDLIPSGREAPYEMTTDKTAAASNQDPHLPNVRRKHTPETLPQACSPVWKPRSLAARAAKNGIRRPCCSAAELRARDGRHSTAYARLDEDRLSKISPAAVAVGGDVVEAVGAAHNLSDNPGEVSDVRWAAALVVDDMDLILSAGRFEHRPYEVPACPAEEPGRTNYPSCSDLALAGELRAAVDRERIWVV